MVELLNFINMKNNLFLLTGIVFSLSSCSSYQDENVVQSVQTPATRAIITGKNSSETNPKLFSDWENCEEITLNSVGTNGIRKDVTAPWKDGSVTSLPEEFRKDIKKIDGWKMIFHSFKRLGLDEKQNYICMYNIFTGFIKVFFYYEGENQSQGAQWFVKTSDKKNSDLFNLSEYVVINNQDAEKGVSEIICSNLTGDPSSGISHGWNGFEFEVPFNTDLRGVNLTIGAYNKNNINYNFFGKSESESVGTITSVHQGSKGILGSVASLMGNGAQSFVGKTIPKFIKNQQLSSLISKIPAGAYSSLISSGLGIIFGKSTTVDNSTLKFTTSGSITMNGTAEFVTTSGVPPITFNLANALDINNANYKIGVWTASPKIIYPRFTPLTSKRFHGVTRDGRDVYAITTRTPKMYPPYVTVNINPELKPYVKSYSYSIKVVRCDSLNGKPYKPEMIDFSDFFWQKKGSIYRDNFVSFYDNDQSANIHEVRYVKPQNANKCSDYDWGYIDCGRMLAIVTVEIKYVYGGKEINVTQSRTYEPYYDIDDAHIGDADETAHYAINADEPFFNEKKKKFHLPLIDWPSKK